MTRISANVWSSVASAKTRTAEAEIALQEFIDALQVLILLLPSADRMAEGCQEECLTETAVAALRTLAAARQLNGRLAEVARCRRREASPIDPIP